MQKGILIYNINLINSTLNGLDGIAHRDFLATISNDYNKFTFVYKLLESVGFSKSKITSDSILKKIATPVSY